jgi:hypothetical protein
MFDFASARGLEIASATVRNNIAVIVNLDCTISFLLRDLDPLWIEVHRIIAEVKNSKPGNRLPMTNHPKIHGQGFLNPPG